jgi:hypothetical protein
MTLPLVNTATTCRQVFARLADGTPWTSPCAVLKPKFAPLNHRSCRCQPIGMPLPLPDQYIQNATVVLAPAAVDTGRPVTMKPGPLLTGPARLA